MRPPFPWYPIHTSEVAVKNFVDILLPLSFNGTRKVNSVAAGGTGRNRKDMSSFPDRREAERWRPENLRETIHRIRVPIPPAQPWKMSVKCPGRFKRQPGTRKDTSKPTNHREECGASRRLPIRERASRSRPSLLHFFFPSAMRVSFMANNQTAKMNIWTTT